MKNQIYLIVAKLMCDGYSRRAIAKHLGMTVANVNNHIRYARSIGMEARFDRERVLLSRAPLHIEQWLRAQAPDGATAGDVILAILNDVIDEAIAQIKINIFIGWSSEKYKIAERGIVAANGGMKNG